jgi:hypothetical protein
MSTMEPDEGTQSDDTQADAPRWEGAEEAGADAPRWETTEGTEGEASDPEGIERDTDT